MLLLKGISPSHSNILSRSSIENCFQTFYGSLCYFGAEIADETTFNMKSICVPYSFKTATKNIFEFLQLQINEWIENKDFWKKY